jgi:trimeric autotransporter adhesin
MAGATPIITSDGGLSTAEILLAEGLLSVTTVTATDSDGTALTYSLAGGADAAKFKINATTGALEFISRPDFEVPTDGGSDNTYEVIVRVSDGTLTDTQTIVVTIDNVDPVTLTGDEDANDVGFGDATVEGDTLIGLGGNDYLDGGLGADIMEGGLGSDVYYVDNVGDQVTDVDSVEDTEDAVFSSVSWTLGDFIEDLWLGGDTAINGTGNDLNNLVFGNDAANVIDGGLGADDMWGNDGNDTFYVDDVGDIVRELTGEGTDKVFSSISFSLGGNEVNNNKFAENLTLTGAVATEAIGNNLNNELTGNGINNVLKGFGGNDRLAGGAGADAMYGGTGSDTYYVDNLLDTVIEAGVGTDKVFSTKTFTLGDDVENLELVDGAAASGTGNGLNNTLTGNSSNNTIKGMAGNDKIDGAAGTDRMEGGAGNDTFWVRQSTDTVIELEAEGTDTVYSTVTHTLGANVERLILTGLGSNTGTGNALNNTITGNYVNNTLKGLDGNDTLNGGLGNDRMEGGDGNDTFYVDSLSDTVVELADQGTDLVILSKSGYVLTSNVENLRLAGAGNINGYGNSGNNRLGGDTGADVINGGAGADQIVGGGGKDLLIGGTGNDSFIFRAITDSGTTVLTADVISDYNTGDKIDISEIDAIAGGGLANDVFVADADNIYTAGEVEVTQNGSTVTVELFTDNTAGADMVFLVTLGVGVTGVDFLM